MRLVLCLMAACSTSACGIGFGSAYVGQWRAHDKTAFEMCVENEAGECESQTQVKEYVPARRYWGFTLSYPAIGIGMSSLDGDRSAAFRLELSSEYLRGNGRSAFGGRAGGVFDVGADTAMLSVPLMAVWHRGMSERFSFYGAAGYSPYSKLFFPDMESSITSHVGWRALAGMQIVGSRTRSDNRLIWVLEADWLAANFGELAYRSWGLTAHLSLSF